MSLASWYFADVTQTSREEESEKAKKKKVQFSFLIFLLSSRKENWSRFVHRFPSFSSSFRFIFNKNAFHMFVPQDRVLLCFAFASLPRQLQSYGALLLVISQSNEEKLRRWVPFLNDAKNVKNWLNEIKQQILISGICERSVTLSRKKFDRNWKSWWG